MQTSSTLRVEVTASPLTSLTLQYMSTAIEANSRWTLLVLPKQLQATHLLPPLETLLETTALTIAPTVMTMEVTTARGVVTRARHHCRSLIGRYLHMVWPSLLPPPSLPASCKPVGIIPIASRIMPAIVYYILPLMYSFASLHSTTFSSRDYGI